MRLLPPDCAPPVCYDGKGCVQHDPTRWTERRNSMIFGHSSSRSRIGCSVPEQMLRTLCRRRFYLYGVRRRHFDLIALPLERGCFQLSIIGPSIAANRDRMAAMVPRSRNVYTHAAIIMRLPVAIC